MDCGQCARDMEEADLFGGDDTIASAVLPDLHLSASDVFGY